MLVRPRLVITILIALVFVAAAALVYVRAPRHGSAFVDSSPAEPLRALAEASGWLGNAQTADSLRGRVVILVLWSDTEPLSLRLLRDADAWRQAYGRFGLSVIGVHVPEFAFSADSSAPAAALRRLDVHLPVALDAGSRVGSRLGVGDQLPLWIVADAHGRRVFAAEGDRGDDVIHAAIVALRRSAAPEALTEPPPAPNHVPAAPRRVYCGLSRVVGGPLSNATPGELLTFTAQFRYQEQGEAFTPYPVGRWVPAADGVTSARGGAADYIAIRYDGGRVDAVLGARQPTRVWVMYDDGWMPAPDRGEDIRVDARGATFVEVDASRPYAIVKGGGPHVLRLSPEAAGVTYYVFSFGAE